MLYLVASAAVVAAATAEMVPAGIVVGKGQTLEYTDKTIQTPSVTVESGGTLILSGTTLVMDGASNGTANIWVKGGTMKILASSEIKSANENRYTFWVDAGSTFEMRDSTMSGCGYQSVADSTKGLLIKADGTTIENNDFGINYVCVIFDGTRNAKITGNRFSQCELQAASVKNSNSAEISSNEFSINDEQRDSLLLSSCLSVIVSDNVFENPFGIGLTTTNSSIIKNNELRDSTGSSITINAQGGYSKENMLENNMVAGRLNIKGISNTVKGGAVRAELYIEGGANNNAFDGVDFSGATVTLNSGTTIGTAFDNNVFDGTEFTEDNAVVRLGNGNTLKNNAFGSNVTILVEGTGNTIEGVTITDAAGIMISGGNLAAGEGSNVIRESTIALQPGKSITCDG
ncbi:hypothetical protein COU36_02135, partial [Candidatus Micrarchaeota archaeon CG10_big_fil_rev_8_21_14_0_10_59_7]